MTSAIRVSSVGRLAIADTPKEDLVVLEDILSADEEPLKSENLRMSSERLPLLELEMTGSST